MNSKLKQIIAVCCTSLFSLQSMPLLSAMDSDDSSSTVISEQIIKNINTEYSEKKIEESKPKKIENIQKKNLKQCSYNLNYKRYSSNWDEFPLKTAVLNENFCPYCCNFNKSKLKKYHNKNIVRIKCLNCNKNFNQIYNLAYRHPYSIKNSGFKNLNKCILYCWCIYLKTGSAFCNHFVEKSIIEKFSEVNLQDTIKNFKMIKEFIKFLHETFSIPKIDKLLDYVTQNAFNIIEEHKLCKYDNSFNELKNIYNRKMFFSNLFDSPS